GLGLLHFGFWPALARLLGNIALNQNAMWERMC
ncbi:hypothetical protein D1AOALGA4SA_7943, partial [Olavius algarvensis Delta 1 endosymbiont]